MKIKSLTLIICWIAFISQSIAQGRIISIVGGSVIAYDDNFTTCDTLYTFYEREVPPNGRLVQLTDGTFYGQSYASFFKMNADGTGYEIIKRFLVSEGQELSGNFIFGSDGYFYGVAEHSGTNNYGTVFRIQPDGNNFQVLHQFDEATGNKPTHIIELSDGTLVGTTVRGGNDGAGFIFKLNKDGSNFGILKDFSPTTDGSAPRGIMQASNGYLYGVNNRGGANNHGTIFKLATNGTGFQVLKAVDGLTEGGGPNGVPVEAADGFLYFPVRYWGVTTGGNGTGKGTLCKMEKDGSNFSVLKIFEQDGLSGIQPTGKLLIDANTIYGTTEVGGTNNNGVVYSINTDGTNFSVLKSLTKSGEGDNPFGGIIEGNDGGLYGICESGGIDDFSGSIYKIDKDGSNFSIINNFSSEVGLGPVSNLAEQNEIIYGTTDGGGIFGNGTIFSINADGTDFMTLHNFNGPSDGSSPRNLIITQNRIYGYCLSGGSNEFYGTLFKMDLDGSNYTVIQVYDNPGGAYYLKLGSDGIIYGYHGLGVYFQLNPSDDVLTEIGQGFLKQPLTEDADGLFYSTLTSSSGFVIYKMNKDGSNIQQLFSSTDMTNNGRGVWRLEVGADGKLYGATGAGGNNNLGTYFSINRDGTGFNVIYQLGGGPIPFQRFQLLSDGNFYGYNSYISSSHFLRIPPDGSPVTSLKSYDVVEEGYGRDDYFIEIGGGSPTPPSCPMYYAPENAMDSIGTKTLLNWSEANLATGYKVYVGTDGGGTQTPTNLINGTTVSTNEPPIYELNNLQPNTTYYWQIISFNNAEDADNCSIWSFQTAAEPTNNFCANAINLTPNTSCTKQLFTNLGSSNSMQLPTDQCTLMESDIWFKVLMPSSGDLTIETSYDSSGIGLFDVDMEIYTGDCNGLNSIACGGDIDFMNINLQVRHELSDPSLANQTLFIRVWGGFGEQGNFNICAHDPSVINNNCNPCDSIIIPNTVFEGDSIFIACDSINSEMIIQNSMNNDITEVSYKAGLLIKLMPGFYAKAGVEFIAEIEDSCEDNILAEENSMARVDLFNSEEFTPSQLELTVYPNPFSFTTTIQYNLPQSSPIQISLYDINGRLVQVILPKSYKEAGLYEARIVGNDLQEGLYYVQLVSEKEQLMQKVMMVK